MDNYVLHHVKKKTKNETEKRVVVVNNKIFDVTVSFSSREARCQSITHAPSGNDDVALSYCTDCSITLCPECWSIHQTAAETKHHSIINCGEYVDPLIVHSSKSDDKNFEPAKCDTAGSKVGTFSIGKPFAIRIESTSMILKWARPSDVSGIERYEIRYKPTKEIRWKKEFTEGVFESIQLRPLIPNAAYEAQVRVVLVDGDCQFGEKSDEIWTKKSLAQIMRDNGSKTRKIVDGMPAKYKVEMKEKPEYRRQNSKVCHAW